MIIGWRRPRWAQWIASTLIAACETGVFGLIALVAIVWGGDVLIFGASSQPVIDVAMHLFLIIMLVALPLTFAMVLVPLWPMMIMLSAMLWFPARKFERLAAPAWWIFVGAAVGGTCGFGHFWGGTPAFDIVESRFAPVVTLVWTTAIGAFAGWRLHRQLGRIASPVAPGPACA